MSRHRNRIARLRAGMVERDGRRFNPIAPHGTRAGYGNYGCRCAECSSARTGTRMRLPKDVDERDLPPAHGTMQSYKDGCRCELCDFAARVSRRRWASNRKSDRVEVDGRLIHPHATHGTEGGYTNYGCRCVECTAAHAKALSDRKLERFAQRVLVDGLLIHPNAPHGAKGSRSGYGCECQLCYPSGGSKGKTGRLSRYRTTCANGHEINDENTRFIYNDDGTLKRRRCRVCDRERTAQRRRAAKMP